MAATEQSLLAGQAQQERGLLVTTAETAAELRVEAQAHGWSLDAIEILDLAAAAPLAQPAERQTL